MWVQSRHWPRTFVGTTQYIHYVPHLTAHLPASYLEAKMSSPLVHGVHEVGETRGENVLGIFNPVMFEQFK